MLAETQMYLVFNKYPVVSQTVFSVRKSNALLEI